MRPETNRALLGVNGSKQSKLSSTSHREEEEAGEQADMAGPRTAATTSDLTSPFLSASLTQSRFHRRCTQQPLHSHPASSSLTLAQQLSLLVSHSFALPRSRFRSVRPSLARSLPVTWLSASSAMARIRGGRANKAAASTSSRGRKRNGRHQSVRGEEQEEQQRESEQLERQEDVDVQYEEERKERQQRPAKRAARGRQSSAVLVDSEGADEDEQLFSYDAAEPMRPSMGAGDAEDAGYASDEVDEDSDAGNSLAAKKILDKLFEVS